MLTLRGWRIAALSSAGLKFQLAMFEGVRGVNMLEKACPKETG